MQCRSDSARSTANNERLGRLKEVYSSLLPPKARTALKLHLPSNDDLFNQLQQVRERVNAKSSAAKILQQVTRKGVKLEPPTPSISQPRPAQAPALSIQTCENTRPLNRPRLIIKPRLDTGLPKHCAMLS